MMLSAIHNLLRYAVLLSTLFVAAQSLMGMMGKKEFLPANRKIALLMMISCDLQLLVGLALYYVNGHLQMLQNGTAMANTYNRFYTVEHPVGMLAGIVLVHLAYANAKKPMESSRKFKRVYWFSFIALFIFLATTPWPGKKDVGKPMFPTFTSLQ